MKLNTKELLTDLEKSMKILQDEPSEETFGLVLQELQTILRSCSDYMWRASK